MQVPLAISVSKHFGSAEYPCLGGSSISEGCATASLASHVPAAILGMHTLMSNQQYYQALGSSSIVNKEGLNSEYQPLTAVPAPLPRPQPGHRGSLHQVVFPLPTYALWLVAEVLHSYGATSTHLFLVRAWNSCLIYKGLFHPNSIKIVLLYFLLKVLAGSFLRATSESTWNSCLRMLGDELKLSFLFFNGYPIVPTPFFAVFVCSPLGWDSPVIINSHASTWVCLWVPLLLHESPCPSLGQYCIRCLNSPAHCSKQPFWPQREMGVPKG